MLEQIRCGFRLLFLALSFRAVPAHADCLSPSTALVSPFRQAELDLDLGLDYDAGSLAGAAGYLLENWGSAPATCANLLLNRLFNVTAVVDSAGRPLRFSQRVAVFDDDSSLQVLLLSVRLPRPVAGGRRIRLRVRLAPTRLMVERFRDSDSIAMASASGGTVGFRRSSAVRSRDTSTISAVVSRPSVPVGGPVTSSSADTVAQPIAAKS